MVSEASHFLLLLSDSALPLGSFAFSSGLESYIANIRPQRMDLTGVQRFVILSLASTSSAAIPYVLAAWQEPQRLERLDNDLDASTLCQVARRASVAQGRALLGVWERSLANNMDRNPETEEAAQALESFSLSCGELFAEPRPFRYGQRLTSFYSSTRNLSFPRPSAPPSSVPTKPKPFSHLDGYKKS